MKYKIISGYDKKELEEQIEYYLSIGWDISGGLAVLDSGGSLFYYQSIILRESVVDDI